MLNLQSVIDAVFKHVTGSRGFYFSQKLKVWFVSLVAQLAGFRHSSVGKEFACKAGEPGSIPGLEKSSGEGIGYPLQYSWASLVAQLV